MLHSSPKARGVTRRAMMGVAGVLFLTWPRQAMSFWEILRTDAADYAEALARSLRRFDSQAATTLQTYDEASISRQFAQQVSFAINDIETKQFISKWEVAASESNSLVKNFEDVVSETRLFFSFLRKEAASISNDRMRGEILSELSARESDFQDLLRQAQAGVKDLRSAVQAGNDVVTAIKIRSAFSIIDEKVREISTLGRKSATQAAVLRSVARDGLRILDGMRAKI